MKAALIVESLTGRTWRAAELVADGLQQEGWSITGLSKVSAPDHASIQSADLVLVGTWVHGLFVVGQAPWGAARISNLPAMRGKQAAAFCTFALDPGKSLDKLSAAVGATGADVIGAMALRRDRLEAHSEELVSRLRSAGRVASITPLTTTSACLAAWSSTHSTVRYAGGSRVTTLDRLNISPVRPFVPLKPHETLPSG